MRRLFVASGGFLTDRRLRRILALAGWQVTLGLPGPGDWVGVWGASPTAWRGEALARARRAGVLRVEDAFLRSVRPGREGEPPLGLLLDAVGIHFDGRAPSALEHVLRTADLDNSDLVALACACIARLKASHLSKYNVYDSDAPAPAPGYVLVVDQTAGDAAVRASGGDAATFRALLALARDENPGRRILIRTHPETQRGLRPGHFRPEDLKGVEVSDQPVSPWRLLDGADAVYTLSSQLGFEAILAGHRPVVLGRPFYAGWGQSDDRNPPARRGRRLTAEQLFAGAMILAPTWHDPYRDRLCDLPTAIGTLEAQVRAWREDHRGWVATGMRLWKRRPLQRAFGTTQRVLFADPPAAVARRAGSSRRLMVWAGRITPELATQGAVRVEDGFLRSRGLGAELVPALSLCLDDLGIYYDPSRESRLERLIAESVDLPGWARARAAGVVARLTASGLTKYNLGGAGLPPLPPGRRILVPGQVEDDASVRLGAGEVRTNRALLAAARAANPGAVILYKPHPDVEAGLRIGAVPDAADLADAVLGRTDPVAALAGADQLWTITSGLGFEALLRGVPVTCLGAPFYAGWGLTTDLGPEVPRRAARPDVTALAHAALIAYPRYFDPVTGLPCPVEVILDRLSGGAIPGAGPANRALSRLQGALASLGPFWR